MRICDYGCGQKAKHQLKNGKWCCSESHNSCQVMRKKNSIKNLGKIRSVECIERNRISHLDQIPWNKGKSGLQVVWNKGLTKETDERVLKYSKTVGGREVSNKTRKKIGEATKRRFNRPEKNPMYGVRRFGEDNPFFKKNHTKETRKKLSILAIERFEDPTKHPSWINGNSRNRYPSIFFNKEWRFYIYERDSEKFCWNPQCEGISSRETLHHIDYDKDNCLYINIIKICDICNSLANFNRDWWESFYIEIMRRREL